MLLLEHHGKALLRQHGIAVPKGIVAASESAVAQAIGGLPPRVVVKAQIASGGRGKAGGIAFADSAADARAASARLLGRTINGLRVETLLIEERLDSQRERYAALAIEDGAIRLMFGRKGGVNVEDITAQDSRNIATMDCDPIDGPNAALMEACFNKLGFAAEYRRSYELLGRDLFALARARDATLVEINPLAECRCGRLVALDARIEIDDNATVRQREIAALLPPRPAPKDVHSGYVALPFKHNAQGGEIGLIGLGGGLNVTLMDWIAGSGAQVASLVDIDSAIASGHAAQGFADAFAAFDRNPEIRAIFVNIITCGYRLDDIVENLLRAHKARPAARLKPMILHLRGNAMAHTPAMLAAAGCSNSGSIEQAVAAAVAAARA
jgi:succinyl-CoA synthetase beta subunit